MKTKSKSGLTIDTSGGGIKIKSGEQKFSIGGRLMMDYDSMDSGIKLKINLFQIWNGEEQN